MKKIYSILIAVSVIVNMIIPTVYAGNTFKSDKYTVGPGYILGVEESCTAEDFMNAVQCPESSYIEASDGSGERTGNIQTGDILKADGEEYIIYTKSFKRSYIINDDFEDGTTGAWIRTGGDVSKFSSAETEEYGNALTITGTGTVTGYRAAEISDNPAVIIEEMDLRFPELNSDQVGMIVKNASEKYLSVMRLMKIGGAYGLYSLDPGGYYTLKTNIEVGKWYNIKNITRTSDGIISTYIDGVCVAENKQTQAVVNSPGDYIPKSVNINVNNMATEAAAIQIADYKMYTAETISVEKIEYISNGSAELDLRSVPTDMPQIKIHFMTDGGKIDAESLGNGIKIVDFNGNEVECETVFDSKTEICTVTPRILLNNNSKYSVKIENVTDCVSGFSFDGIYNFETDSNNIPFILASAEAKVGNDIYGDISTIRKDTDTITLHFICREGTDIDAENIDEHFKFTDKDGNKADYAGEYDAEEHSYTFTLKSELVSGREYKIIIDKLRDTADGAEYSKEINVKAVGSSTVDTNKYTVGDGYILGVKEGIAVEEFLSDITCLGNPEVYEGDTDNIRTDKIYNGDTLGVSDKKYTIETDIYPNDDIFFDTFNDGDTGKWSRSSMMAVINDEELGKALSWTGDGATDAAKKNFTSQRSISINDLPDTLILEYDIKFPVFNSTLIGLIMKNSASKYLATMRLLPEGGEYKIKTLYTGGYKELLSGVKENKNYHFKYVMDTSTGLCDIYIDGKLAAEKMEMQAITNSPGNYTPTSIEISGQNINSDGITLIIDNVELYSPTTVRTAGITLNRGDSESGILEAVPVDFDSVKIKLSCENALETDRGSISLEDADGKTVDCEITENPGKLFYTLRPKCILQNDSEYNIVISDIADSVYKIPYSRRYKLTTNSKAVSAKIYGITAKSGDKEYDSISDIRTDTEEIQIKFIFGNGVSVNSEGIENAVGLYIDGNKIETENTYNELDGVFTLRLLSQLTSGETYKLEINNLKDVNGNTVLSRSISMRAAAAWMVEAGDILYSDIYNVSSGEISGIKYGTRAAELWDGLHMLPGTKAVIYGDSALQTVNTGILSDGNVIEAYNSFTGDRKIYKLSFTGIKIESDSYNISGNLIFGVKNGVSSEEFISKLKIMGADSYEVTGANGETASEITNNAELKLTGGAQTKVYTIETLETEDTVYFMSDFEDGTLNGWSSGTIEEDGEHGNVLSGIINGATADAKKSFSASKALNITDNPEILVFETDVKVPVLPKSTISIQAKNSKDKYLSVFRIDQKETFYTLIPNAQSTISENMQANRWYHVTYVNNCEKGETDIYLDGKLLGEGLKFQATENYIPSKLLMSVDNTTSNGTVLSIDNMTMYAPNPIKTGCVEIISGGEKSRDLTRVPVDTDEINIYLTVKDGYSVKNDAAQCVTLVDADGNEVSATTEYNADTKTVKIVPNEVLECNADYSIKIQGIKDDIYSKSFSDEIKLRTTGYEINVADMFIMNESGEMQNDFSFERLTVYAPVINYGDKKCVTLMLALYDDNGRLITCASKEIESGEAAVGEAVFKLNMSGHTKKAVSAKIYSREKNGGPLSAPFTVNMTDK